VSYVFIAFDNDAKFGVWWTGMPVAGIGLTGALASVPPKRGDHRSANAYRFGNLLAFFLG
jgi:hypothetical protein